MCRRMLYSELLHLGYGLSKLILRNITAFLLRYSV
jgi:hypothetical protein